MSETGLIKKLNQCSHQHGRIRKKNTANQGVTCNVYYFYRFCISVPLTTHKLLCCPSERKRGWVSKYNITIRAHNELCRFRSDILRSYTIYQRRVFFLLFFYLFCFCFRFFFFFQNMKERCFVTSSGTAWLNTVF